MAELTGERVEELRRLAKAALENPYLRTQEQVDKCPFTKNRAALQFARDAALAIPRLLAALSEERRRAEELRDALKAADRLLEMSVPGYRRAARGMASDVRERISNALSARAAAPAAPSPQDSKEVE